MELIAALNKTILAQVEEENKEAEMADSSEFMDGIDICFTTLEAVKGMEIVALSTQASSSQQDQ